VDDEIMGFIVLNSLPDDQKWDTFRTTTLGNVQKGSKLTFDGTCDAIRAHQLLLNRKSTTDSETTKSASALASKSSTSGSLYCKHHGNCLHSTEDCQVLNRESESRDQYRSEHKHSRSSRNSCEKGSKRDKKHSARQRSSKSSSHRVYVSRALMERVQLYKSSMKLPKSHDSIIDSGASSHM
ncbi:hypothetical protein C8J56DRAFT_721451, partial [Mycena floridula]